MKRWVIGCLACGAAVSAEAGLANLNLRGEIRGNFTEVVTTTNSLGVWRVTLAATNTDSSSQFLFENSGYVNKWSRGATISFDTVETAFWQGGDTLFSQTSGRFYTFCMADTELNQNSSLMVMETTNAPIGLLSQSNDAATAGNGPFTAWVNLSGPPSTNERVWLRWTSNNFASSAISLATGSGTNLSAAIPAQNTNATVNYYWLTSTAASNTVAASPDLCTIRFLNNGGTNYSFTILGFGNSWHFPTNAEPSGAFMRNPPTNGMPPSAGVFIYNGTYTNDSNQTGGSLFYRKAGDPAYVEKALAFDSNTGFGNQYWVAAITGNTFAATNEVEYFLKITYNNRATTFLGTTNAANPSLNVKYATTNEAAANPFRFTYGSGANLGNAWHVPANLEPPGVTMRNPAYDPPTNAAVFIYNGNQFQGGAGAGDQSGGTLFFRKVGEASWVATALVFNAESGEVGNNKYWRGRIPPIFGTTNEVEYYLRITYTDRDTTYLGTSNQTASFTTFSEAVAQAAPFRYTYSPVAGSAAAYLWHSDNRVALGGSNVQFWVKIGYAEGTGSNRYVDEAYIYLTQNGAAPHADHGQSTNALVIPMQFSHMQEDSYEGGDAMWWVGVATNLPSFTLMRYRIGAFKNTNSLERFADYGTSGTNNAVFSFSLGTAGSQVLTVNGLNADYTTTKFFVDEIAGDQDFVVVRYTPGAPNVTNVEVFSNLDRRDYADVDYTNALIPGDGYPDGIHPPDGNFLTIADTGAYFRAWTMLSAGGGEYVWTGRVSKTGAYRLTARFQTNGSPAWTWYSGNGRRDHAIVVSPRKALDMTLYELNTLTVEATAPTFAGRSTFRDLLSVADPGGDDDAFDPFNLEYLNFLQANCLWFQPIHPSGYERAENDPNTGSPYAPGSPYATKDYWAVMPVMGAGNSEASALDEFTNYVARCDAYTGTVGRIHVMLDGVFNHTSWDAVMGQGGVDLGFSPTPTNRIGHLRPQWYAKLTDYGEPATYYTSAYLNDFATAPDRGDFGKWNDVTELYFGKYSALVRHNPENNGDYLNEDDVFDFAGMTPDIQDLWRYFAYYPEYWLKKTGHSGTNSWIAAEDDKGIDALRCDFGQGLPPQIWEYIINRTRSKKWNFVFMAETLDGGKPGYRSNRHFDILNENLVFQFTQSKISDSSSLSYAFYLRNLSYNGGAILLNVTSHDEVMPDNDGWLTLSRYAAISSMAGLPMIFYGQERGIGLHDPFNPNAALDGFADHELNFGKYVPHFKRWNQLQIWTNPPPFTTGMDQLYGRINWARLNSPALRSRNHRVLATTGGPEDSRIFAVAKWETSGAGPATSDVVLAFTRFMEHGGGHTQAANTFNLQPVWAELGLSTAKQYTVRNLASGDAFANFTNGWPKSGADLLANGIYVDMKVDVGQPITEDGAIVQYLKLVELPSAPNQPPVISLPGPHVVALGSSTSFPVSVTDADGDPVTTNFVSGPAGATYVGGLFSWTALPTNFVNTTNWVVFTADDQRGDTNSVVTNITFLVVPWDADGDGMGDDWEILHFASLTNDAAGDADGDGVPNFDEYVARTAPTNAASVFRLTSEVLAGVTNRLITIATEPGRKYVVYFADGSPTNGTVWQPFANGSVGIGSWIETNASSATYTFRDDEGPATTLGPPASGQRHYRAMVTSP